MILNGFTSREHLCHQNEVSPNFLVVCCLFPACLVFLFHLSGEKSRYSSIEQGEDTGALAEMTPVIAIEGVQKRYGKTQALRNVSLEIHAGEVFGLLGPNGAGKTTLLHILVGIEEASDGKILIFDAPPSDLARRSSIGFLPEMFSSYEFLTVEETVQTYAEFFSAPGHSLKSRIEELLRRLGLWEHRKKKLSECSKGMVRKVGIAASLVHSPSLWILDEPTIGLDPESSAVLKEIIQGNRRNGGTVLLSSHILSEVEKICSRVAILHHGEVLRIGLLTELLEFPESVHLLIQDGSTALLQFLSEIAIKSLTEPDGRMHYWIPESEQKKCLAEITRDETAKLLLCEPYHITLEEFFLKTVK